MLNMNHPRQRGIHITGRETAEMRGCHRDDGGTKKKRGSTHGLLRKCQPQARQRIPGGIGRHGRESREDGNDQGGGREDVTKSKEREVKTVRVLQTM